MILSFALTIAVCTETVSSASTFRSRRCTPTIGGFVGPFLSQQRVCSGLAYFLHIHRLISMPSITEWNIFKKKYWYNMENKREKTGSPCPNDTNREHEKRKLNLTVAGHDRPRLQQRTAQISVAVANNSLFPRLPCSHRPVPTLDQGLYGALAAVLARQSRDVARKVRRGSQTLRRELEESQEVREEVWNMLIFAMCTTHVRIVSIHVQA
jgi:hypothetical protein